MTITDDAMVQMNVRMPSSLKKKGDAALQAAGYSPSQAVRALWTYAADYEGEPSAIEQMLRELIEEAERHDRKARLERAKQMREELWSSFRAEMGGVSWSDFSDEELYEQALMEKYGEGQAR